MMTWLCVMLAVTSTAGPIAGLIALWVTVLGLAVWFRRFRGKVLIAGLLALFFWPHVGGRAPSPTTMCLNNMKQLQLAILNYEADHGHLPPPYTVDSAGNRLHSWRVLLLPYLDAEELYRQIDLTKPWNHPVNVQFADQMPEIYSCPAYEPAPPAAKNTTAYVVLVGPQTAWPSTGIRRMSDVTDGTASTISVVESEFNRVPWMAPFDPTFDSIMSADGTKQTILERCRHKGGAVYSHLDGSIQMSPADLDLATLRAMLTIAGGEELPK